jgi:hypothetical protein
LVLVLGRKSCSVEVVCCLLVAALLKFRPHVCPAAEEVASLQGWRLFDRFPFACLLGVGIGSCSSHHCWSAFVCPGGLRKRWFDGRFLLDK